MQKILVTGANGFVGTQLCRVLADSGYAVRRAVRVANPNAPIAETVAVGEIGPATVWTRALEDIQLVVHLAARAHVMREPAGTALAAYRDINVFGTQSLALAARAAGVQRFIFVSSIKVNGEGTRETPFTEADLPRPEDAYGVSKWEAEQTLWRTTEESSLGGIVLRPPLVYGPGVRGNFLSLMRAIDRGLPLPLASVRNRRSLLYVGNLVSAIVLCLAHPAATGKTYLLADDTGVSTPDLMRSVGNALGKPARLMPFPPILLRLAATAAGKAATISRLLGSLQVDSSEIRRELGWHPPYDKAVGLQQTAEWYHRRHNASPQN